MPTFRVTKKLATALKLKLPTSRAELEHADHVWFADLFFVAGKKCVIWVHGPTLLTFVRPAVVAAELREFHGLFRYEFRTAIAYMALPESLLDRFGDYGAMRYGPTNDRRIIGSMLDYRNMFDVMVGMDGGLARADIPRINAQLNESPMSVLGMESPVRVVRKLVEEASTMLH